MIIRNAIEDFRGITEDDWMKKSSPEKWSKKQILGHLIDSALTNLRRFVVTQYAQKQKIVYHQDDWVEIQQYQGADIAEMIALWRLLNLQLIRVINGMPDAKLQNICDTGKTNTEYHTLEFLLGDYITHLIHHLGQITKAV